MLVAFVGELNKREQARDRGEGNPRAISCRLESVSDSTAKFRRRHAMRIGKQPAYVDGERSHLNSILMPYPTPAVARAEAVRLYRLHEPKRKMQTNAPVLADGVVTFGHIASAWISELDHDTQNAMFRAVVDAVCKRYDLELRGLVVHRDETALHAHFATTARTLDGSTTAARAIDGRVVQDIAAEVARQYDARIERGYSSKSRLEAGAAPVDVRHKSVRELHETQAEDLDKRLEGRRQELADLEALVRDAEARAEKTQERLAAAQEKLDEAGGAEARLVQRVQNYESRLATHQQELSTLETELAARRAAAKDQAEATRLREEAQKEREDIAQDRAQIAREREGMTSTRELLSKELREVQAHRTYLRETGRVILELASFVGARLGIDHKLSALTDALEKLRDKKPEAMSGNVQETAKTPEETLPDLLARSKLARKKPEDDPGPGGLGR